MNPFVAWLVEHHGRAYGPVGVLARDLRHWPLFPESGGHKKLRNFLESSAVDTSVLDAFDKAWAEWMTCLSPGCTAEAAGGSSSFCPAHGGRSHQAVRSW